MPTVPIDLTIDQIRSLGQFLMSTDSDSVRVEPCSCGLDDCQYAITAKTVHSEYTIRSTGYMFLTTGTRVM